MWKYRISARVITLSLPNGSSGLNVLHINRKSLTRAFDRYTVVNMTHGVIFIRQTDDRQIDVAPFVFNNFDVTLVEKTPTRAHAWAITHKWLQFCPLNLQA
jgi:hypothetical protein